MLCCNSMLCVSHWLKSFFQCFPALWVSSLHVLHKPELAQCLFMLISSVSQDPGLTSVRVSVYTYSSCWLFAACFSVDTVLQQLICHDMFLLCTTSQIPPVVRSNLRPGRLWEMAPSVENPVSFNLFPCIYIIIKRFNRCRASKTTVICF